MNLCNAILQLGACVEGKPAYGMCTTKLEFAGWCRSSSFELWICLFSNQKTHGPATRQRLTASGWKAKSVVPCRACVGGFFLSTPSRAGEDAPGKRIAAGLRLNTSTSFHWQLLIPPSSLMSPSLTPSFQPLFPATSILTPITPISGSCLSQLPFPTLPSTQPPFAL